MSESKIDLRAIFNDVKNNVLTDSSEKHSDEEVRRLYSRMTCIKFMRPLLNYASGFALLHDRAYDQKFIDLLLFNTSVLEPSQKTSFDPINSSLNFGYCVVKEVAVLTPDVSPTMLQGVFRASFPYFSNNIRSCLEAYNYQKAKPELLVAVFRDVYRALLDDEKYSRIIDLVDGDFPASQDTKASLTCTELNALFKLSVTHNFHPHTYANEGLTKSTALDSVLTDTVSTVDLWIKQIADDVSRKGVLASDAGVKLVQNLMNVTSDIMYDELIHQIKLSNAKHSESEAHKANYIEASRRGFIQRVSIYAEKTESIAFTFDNYVNMIGSVLYQQIYSVNVASRSTLGAPLNPSSLPKVVKLICMTLDSGLMRLKDYLKELKDGILNNIDDYEFAATRHYRSSGDIVVDILEDLNVASRISHNYINQLIRSFELSDDLKSKHWFSAEITQSILAAVTSFRRVSEDVTLFEKAMNESLDHVINDIEKFIRNNKIDWVASNDGYNPSFKSAILSAMVCSSVKALAKNAKILELTYVVKPYQIRDVVLYSLNQTKNFFASHRNGMLSGLTAEGAVMVFQNLMNNISTFYADAVYSSIVNVSKDPQSSKADYMYNYHTADSEIQPMLSLILEHATKVHESVNLMRITHLVSHAKKTEVAPQSEVMDATEKTNPQPTINNGIKVRTLR